MSVKRRMVSFLLKCGFVSGQHFSLRHLGIYEPPPQRGLTFCSDLGVSHRGFSVGAGQDLDDDGRAATSPEHGRRLWCHGDLGKSSERSSCLSSRSNSALTLTDTEHENKSDSENGRKRWHLPALKPCHVRAFKAFSCLRFFVSTLVRLLFTLLAGEYSTLKEING